MVKRIVRKCSQDKKVSKGNKVNRPKPNHPWKRKRKAANDKAVEKEG